MLRITLHLDMVQTELDLISISEFHTACFELCEDIRINNTLKYWGPSGHFG